MTTHSFSCKQAIPAFTPQLQSITAFGWYSFYRPTEGRRLSPPGLLVTYQNKVLPPAVEPGYGDPVLTGLSVG